MSPRALLACALALLCAGCTTPDPAPPPPPPPHHAAAETCPAGLPAATFFWRTIRLDRDRAEDFRGLRNSALAIFGAAAHLTGDPKFTDAALAALDDSSNAAELEAVIGWFDRPEEPQPSEGIEVVITRRQASGQTLRLTLILEDAIVQGRVDGSLDRVQIHFSNDPVVVEGSPRGGGDRLISLGFEGDRARAHDIVNGKDVVTVTSADVRDVIRRAEREIWEPLTGDRYVRQARAGALRPARRAAPPTATSFPALIGAAVGIR